MGKLTIVVQSNNRESFNDFSFGDKKYLMMYPYEVVSLIVSYRIEQVISCMPEFFLGEPVTCG